MTPEARALADYMSELSEQAYYAGWMLELEYELWQALTNGPRKYGRLQVTGSHIAQLLRLSNAAGGWISFDSVHGESFVKLDEWRVQFSKWKTSKKRS